MFFDITMAFIGTKFLILDGRHSGLILCFLITYNDNINNDDIDSNPSLTVVVILQDLSLYFGKLLKKS
jgi:hypothetical protein